MSTRSSVFLLCIVLLLGCGDDVATTDTGVASDSSAPDTSPVDSGGADSTIGDSSAPDTSVPAGRTIVLSFEGETLTSGSMESPETNTTPVVTGTRTMPAFDPAPIESSRPREDIIADVVAATAALYAPYDVEVTTERPSGNDYILVVVGGTSSDAGLSFGTTNIGLLDCDDANGAPAIGIVMTGESQFFMNALTESQRITRIAILTAQAVAFGLGLEAVIDCTDVMGAPFTCPTDPTGFLDSDLECGIDTARDCNCGGTTQNSAAHLRTVLGT